MGINLSDFKTYNNIVIKTVVLEEYWSIEQNREREIDPHECVQPVLMQRYKATSEGTI